MQGVIVFRNNFKGFGIIEALVSLFIFAVLLLGLNYSLIIAIENNTANFFRNTAVKIAQGYMDKTRERTDLNTISIADNPCNPDNATASTTIFIDTINYRNTTIKYVTVLSVVSKTSNYYKVNIKTCYKYKNNIKEVKIDSSIYPGKGGL